MTQEEKAKAYDKVIEKIKYVMEHGVQPVLNKEDLQDIFPELAESEDERVRKAILGHLTIMWGNSQDDVCGVHVEDAIAWLEKQGKQKDINPTLLEKEKMDNVFTQMMFKGKTALEAIKEEKVDNANKIMPKWSEEDDNILKAITYTVRNSGYKQCIGVTNEKMRDWLKSLKQKIGE